MRYYIYLDKPFLRTILGSIGELDFDIDVIEYSVIKSYSNNNKLAVDPCIENGNNCEIFKDTEKRKNKEGSFNSEKIRFGMDKGVSCNIQTERKYINISDITDMKNIGFYHKLITKVEQMKNRDINNRLYENSGFITIYETRDENIKENNNFEKDGFFRIDDTCIWYDKEKLQTDINLLSSMSCKINVVGYIINCLENSKKVVKPLAMYIE